MKQKGRKIESDHLLLVEGKDEENFFRKILGYEDITKVDVWDFEGKDNLENTLEYLSRSDGLSDVRAIGIIRDAEKNPAYSAFSSVCSILKKYDLPIPNTIDTIAKGQDKKVGIFIMPNNLDSGMLEDLCLESIKADPVLECVDRYMECCLSALPENEKTVNSPKAKVQTYLASKKDIANSLGIAAQKGYWDFNHNCFHEIKQFLHGLFIAPR